MKIPFKATDYANLFARRIAAQTPELPEVPENNPVDIIIPPINNPGNDNTNLYIGFGLILLALLIVGGTLIYMQTQLSEQLSEIATVRNTAPPLLTQNPIKDVPTEQPEPATEPVLPTA